MPKSILFLKRDYLGMCKRSLLDKLLFRKYEFNILIEEDFVGDRHG